MDGVIADLKPIPPGPDDADCYESDPDIDVLEDPEEEQVADAVPDIVPAGK